MKIRGNLQGGRIVETSSYFDDIGVADAYAVVIDGITSYTEGLTFTFKAANGCNGSSTIEVNSLGVKSIKKNVNTDLVFGDILAGEIIMVVYDGTNFQAFGIGSSSGGGGGGGDIDLLSARVEVVSAQMTSADAALSNAISAVSDNVDAVSAAQAATSAALAAIDVSALSARVASNSAQMVSADNAVLNAISVVSVAQANTSAAVLQMLFMK